MILGNPLVKDFVILINSCELFAEYLVRHLMRKVLDNWQTSIKKLILTKPEDLISTYNS